MKIKLPKAIVPILEEIVERRGLFNDVEDLCLYLIRKGLQSEPPTEVEKRRAAEFMAGKSE